MKDLFPGVFAGIGIFMLGLALLMQFSLASFGVSWVCFGKGIILTLVMALGAICLIAGGTWLSMKVAP